ncbi:MAG: Altered inheritance of mitochondria protein 6 [Claussenomyces sp. TS43310]|nr:MAG: Altered inheritance of mitochondria protein 6 [Claussenomyces sp. TS43310]
MAQSGELSESPVSDDEETSFHHVRTIPHEQFGIEDNPDSLAENGFARKAKTSKLNWWSRLLRMSSPIKSRKPSLSGDEDEDEGLLGEDDHGVSFVAQTDKQPRGSGWRLIWRLLALSSIAWTLYSLTYSILKRLSHQSDPLSHWGEPGNASEGLSWYPTDFLRDVLPIPCHSHNDYWRTVPLFSALYAGCISIEADVWSFGTGILYVGHNTASLTANRTFQSLYINPLVEILERQNPSTEFYNDSTHGVFDTNHKQGLTLLVDVKTDGTMTWPYVLAQLEPLRRRGWLTYVENNVLHPGPITVVGTGETPFDVLTANKTYRDAFFDAPLDTMWSAPDLASDPPRPNEDSKVGKSEEGSASPIERKQLQSSGQGSAGTSPTDEYTLLNSYYASTSFAETLGTVWWGRLSAKQLRLMRGRIKGAHEKGLKVRYWDTPYWPRRLRNHIWDVLVKEGADIVNVDDLESVRKGIW